MKISDDKYRWVVLALLAAVALPAFAYVPEPQPVKSAVEITALYYPGTEQRSEWDIVDQTCPERKPLLGWYDEGNPEAIDWQIKWAVEHGITNFCVDWYWNKGYQRLTHWVKGFQQARYRKYLKWYMMYANHNQPGAHSTEDQIAVTKYWLENYFKTPEYYTIDGKPVVCIWKPENIDKDFIAEAAAKGEKLAVNEGIRRAFAISEKLVREAGLPGIHWQMMWSKPEYVPSEAATGRQNGFESAISYGFVDAARKFAPIAAAKTEGLTYDMVAEGIPKLWQSKGVQQELPWWLPLPTGWDDCPRSFTNAKIVRDRTPEKFAAICREARQFCDKHSLRHVIIHPINEWQEGSYIEPNEEYGFAMYDAIRDAFCEKPAAGWPKNLRPQDVGMGPYDFPPSYRSKVQYWDFTNGFEGWYRQPYGGGELEVKDGALNFWTNWRSRNYNIRQRVEPFAAAKYHKFRLRMRITPNPKELPKSGKVYDLRLKWGTVELPIVGPGLKVDNTRSMVSTPVVIDGEWHEYEVELSSNPDWKGMVDELWFEACELLHARVAIDWMRFEIGAPFPLTVAEWTPPARDFPVVEYGAVSNSLPITDAITRAIDAASAAGGGRVILPKGEWLSGGLTLKSDVALVVPEGCTLRFPDDPVLVYGAPLRADGRPTVTRRGLIEALGCTNVAIMGGGVVKADVEYWHRNFSFNPPKGYPRPHFFNFRDCANVRFEGFKIRGSPAWAMHFTLCTDIVLRDLDSIATGPNTDGLDLESCNRALVERVSLDQTDDTFTIKSGMNAAGRNRNVPTQNVVIRNCRAVHGHSLLGIGSEVSGGVRNIFMTDCTVADECWRWLFVKTNSKRGAFVENVTLQNITGRRASQAVMELTMYYDGNPNKELTKTTVSEFPTRIRGIVCRNITCAEAGAAVKIKGDAALPPAGLVAEDVAIGRLCKPASQLVITNVAPDLVMRNVRLEESAFGRGLNLPALVRRFDPSRDAQPEVVLDRSDFENRADNAVMASVIDARIAAECRTQRNCVPRMVPMGRDYATKSFSIGHVERMEDAFADWGCAFDGAIVADDVSAVSMGGKAVGAELSVDAEEATARLTLTNHAATDATELFVVFLAPTHYMMHRQVFRVDRLASGESRTLDIELGAWARQMPPSQGAAPFAAQVDFSQDGARSRVWCRTDVSAGTTRQLPNDVSWTVGPLDAKVATDESLCALSASEGALANFDTEGGKWRRAAFPGAAATLVSGPKRPYTENERKLVKAKRAVEIVALDFEVPGFAAVRMKFFVGKWGKKAEFFLNGKRLEKCNAQTVLPTKAGRNRLLVRYPSTSGDTRECAHLSVYTWNATNFVPFSDVEKDSSCK